MYQCSASKQGRFDASICCSCKYILVFLVMTSFADYVVLDLETTGLDAQASDVIEVAAVRVRNFEIQDRFESLVYSPLGVSPFVEYLTGISANDLENAPDFFQLKEQIAEFIGDDPLVGHNISFDRDFLRAKGVLLTNNVLWDTYPLSNILYPELPSHSLETNTAFFGIEHSNSHRAMADVLANHELWKRLMASQPSLTEQQKSSLKIVSQKSQWPLLSFFLEELPHLERKSNQEKKMSNQTPFSFYTPQNFTASDYKKGHAAFVPAELQMIHAESFEDGDSRLVSCSQYHQLETLKNLYPEIQLLLEYRDFIDVYRLEKLMEKTSLTTAETTLLIKHILHPEWKTKQEFNLNHPERPYWQFICANSETRDPYIIDYRKKILSSSTLGLVHHQLFRESSIISHYDHLLVTNPHLLTDAASTCYRKVLSYKNWCELSSDPDWCQQGELFFAGISALCETQVQPTTYPEDVVVDENLLALPSFQHLKRSLFELLSARQQEPFVSYLKSYQAFFQHHKDWVRWFKVFPDKTVVLFLEPRDVSVFVDRVIECSQSFKSYSCVPEQAGSLAHILSHSIKLIMPPLNLLSAGNNKETEEKQIAYCLQQLQVLPSKSMIVFSSKSALKRFFFALYAAVPDGMDIFGEDMGGGFSKLLDKWKNSTAGKRLLLTTWRQLRRFPAGVLQVEWIALQALPFNPPSPIHKVRSAEYGNGFINYTMPQVYNHVYESLSHFQLASYQEKPPSQLTLLDGRFQTAEYAQFITESLKSITSE